MLCVAIVLECLHVGVVPGPHVDDPIDLCVAEAGEGFGDHIDVLVHEDEGELPEFGPPVLQLLLLPS